MNNLSHATGITLTYIHDTGLLLGINPFFVHRGPTYFSSSFVRNGTKYAKPTSACSIRTTTTTYYSNRDSGNQSYSFPRGPKHPFQTPSIANLIFAHQQKKTLDAFASLYSVYTLAPVELVGLTKKEKCTLLAKLGPRILTRSFALHWDVILTTVQI